MQRLCFLIGLSLLCGYASAADQLPEGALARYGYAKGSAPDRPVLISADSTSYFADDNKWHSVLTGEVVDPPMQLGEKEQIVQLFSDGRHLVCEKDKERSETAYYLRSADGTKTLHTFAPLADNTYLSWQSQGTTFLQYTAVKKGEDREYQLRWAEWKEGRLSAWQDAPTVPSVVCKMQLNRPGTHYVWLHTNQTKVGIISLKEKTQASFDVPTTEENLLKHAQANHSGELIYLLFDKTFSVHRAKDGTCVHTYETKGGSHFELTQDESTAVLWDLQGLTIVPLAGKQKPVHIPVQETDLVRILPDNKRVLVFDNFYVPRLYEIATGKQLDSMTSNAYPLALRITGEQSATVRDFLGHDTEFNLRTGQKLRSAPKKTGLDDAFTTRRSPFGPHAILTNVEANRVVNNYDARILHTETGKTLLTFNKVSAYEFEPIQFHPDGKRLGFMQYNEEKRKYEYFIYDIATGQKQLELPPSDAMLFSRDGRALFAFSEGGVSKFELLTGQPRWEMSVPVSNRSDGNPAFFKRAGITADQKKLVLVTCQDAFVFDAQNHQILKAISHTSHVREWTQHVYLTKNARWLAAYQYASPSSHLGERGTHKLAIYDLLDASTKEPIKMFDLTGEKKMVTFAIDEAGNYAVTAHGDGTCLSWDLQREKEADSVPTLPKVKLGIWDRLGAFEAKEAHGTMLTLIQSPADALKMFRDKLPVARQAEPKQVERWLSELDHEQFAVRDAANTGLEQVAEQIETELRQALRVASTDEKRSRLGVLLKKVENIHTDEDRLRQHRVVEILEEIGTPDAVELLKQYAAGAKGAYLTREALAALARLKK